MKETSPRTCVWFAPATSQFADLSLTFGWEGLFFGGLSFLCRSTIGVQRLPKAVRCNDGLGPRCRYPACAFLNAPDEVHNRGLSERSHASENRAATR